MNFTFQEIDSFATLVIVGEKASRIIEELEKQSRIPIPYVIIQPDLMEANEDTIEEQVVALTEKWKYSPNILFVADLSEKKTHNWLMALTKDWNETDAKVIGFIITPEKTNRKVFKEALEIKNVLLEKNCGLVWYPYHKRFDKRLTNENHEALEQITTSEINESITGILELVTEPGVINIDWTDVVTVISKGNTAYHAFSELNLNELTDEQVELSIKEAVKSIKKQLKQFGLKWKDCEWALVNITSNEHLSLKTINLIMQRLTKKAKPELNIIMGTVMKSDVPHVQLHVYAVAE